MDDSKIVQLFFDRKEEALSELYLKYGKYCEMIAVNIIGNREDAEECVNSALLDIWNCIPPNKPENLRSFVGKITRNKALDVLRMWNAEKRGGGSSALLKELSEISSGYSVEAVAEQNEIISAINEFLKRLTASKRTVLVLKYWYCCDVSEIAGITGYSEANIYNILKRERKKLMEYLKKKGAVE